MSVPKKISLSIIIVNYRSAALILDSIRTVIKWNPSLDFEIMVVDNDPSADEKEIILQQFPHVLYIPMPFNEGFARANNAGMKKAKGDCILLLNPDTLAVDDSITRCYEKLNASDFVAAGVQLMDADRIKQISGSFFVKGGLNHLLPLPYWGSFIRWLGYRANAKIPGVSEAASTEQVDWISGAFLMVKRKAIDLAGLMDEDFFLYAEEVEWSSRLQKAGPLCIFGDLKIIHLEGGSINKEQNIRHKGYYNLYDKKGLQLMVSNHLRVRKQYGVSWFLFLLLNYTWSVLLFIVLGSLHRIFTLRNPFGHWSQGFAFGKNVVRLWSLAPSMISNQRRLYKMF